MYIYNPRFWRKKPGPASVACGRSEAVACDATALTQFTALSDDAMVLELLKHRHEARRGWDGNQTWL